MSSVVVLLVQEIPTLFLFSFPANQRAFKHYFHMELQVKTDNEVIAYKIKTEGSKTVLPKGTLLIEATPMTTLEAQVANEEWPQNGPIQSSSLTRKIIGVLEACIWPWNISYY